MASGSIVTNAYENLYYELDWNSYANIDGNYSTVYYTLYAKGISGNYWRAERTLNVSLGGHTVISKTNRVQRYGGKITEGNFVVYHNNETGNASISGSIEAAVVGGSINVRGSGSWDLDTIPRKPILRVDNVFNIDVNSCQFHYVVDRSTNFTNLQYRLNGGNAVQAFGNNVKLENLSPNTTYKLQIRGVSANWSIYGDWSGEYIFKTQDIAKITNAIDFTLEKNKPRIEFTKPNNSTFEAYLEKSQVGSINHKVITTSPYEYNLSTQDIDTLYKWYKDENNTIRYVLKTTCNGKEYLDFADRKILFENVNPVFTEFSTKNIDTKTSSKVGVNRYIENISTVEVEITAQQLAEGQKYATIQKYIVYNGKETKEIPTSGGKVNFTNVYNSNVTVSAVDSRGKTTTISKAIKILPYKQPVVTFLNFERVDFVGEQAKIQMNATYTNSFEEVMNNADVFFKLTSEPESAYIQIDGLFNFKDGNITNKDNSVITGKKFDFGTNYDVVVKIKDFFGEIITNGIIVNGNVLITGIKNKGVAINDIYDTSLPNGLQVKGKIFLNKKELLPGGDGLPIGAMIPFGSEQNVPNGWRICDGSAISRTTYKKLFDVIGTSYGAGDGSTTFNLPDKRGRVSIGKDSSTEFNIIGKKGGGNGHHHIYGYSFGEYYGDTMMIDSQVQHNVGAYDGVSMNWAAPKSSGQTYCNVNNGYSTSPNGKTVSRYEVKTRTSNESDLPPYEVDIWIIKVSNENGELSQEKAGTIIDNLTSTSTTDALSANMGRELLALSNKKFESYQNKNIFWNNVGKWGAWYPELSKIKNDNLTTFVENKITFKKAGNYLILATISYEYPGITGMLMNKNGQYVCDNLVSSNGMWSTSGQYTGFFNENDTLQVGMYSDQQGSACHRRTFIDIIEL